MRLALISLLMIPLVVGCEDLWDDKFSHSSDYEVSAISQENDAYGPVISVTPTVLSFGTLAVEEEVHETFFTVMSVGDEALEVESIRIEATDPSFTILSDIDGLDLDPGESVEIGVSFSPMTAGDHVGHAIVNSNAVGDEEEAVQVELLGSGYVSL